MSLDHTVMGLPEIPIADGRLTICRHPKCYATTQRRHVICAACWRKVDALTRDRVKRSHEWLAAHPIDGGAMYRLVSAFNDALSQLGARRLEATQCDAWD
jgi:hypothetical protein